MTLEELLKEGTDYLIKRQVEDASQDAWYLFSKVTGLNRAAFFLKREEAAAPELVVAYRQFLTRRGEHEPLQYLLGEWEFMGLTFAVSPAVLIPRQDTELLVELVLPLVSGKRVLDLCTGSGCIAISLAKLGHPAVVDAGDISTDALKLARQNNEALQAGVKLFCSDLYEAIDGVYDVIVSNPPYIRTEVIGTLSPEVAAHEPRLALDGGEDGLDCYRRIIAGASGHLVAGGILALEIGYDQAEQVAGLLVQQEFSRPKVYQDLNGLDRVVMAQLESE